MEEMAYIGGLMTGNIIYHKASSPQLFGIIARQMTASTKRIIWYDLSSSFPFLNVLLPCYSHICIDYNDWVMYVNFLLTIFSSFLCSEIITHSDNLKGFY